MTFNLLSEQVQKAVAQRFAAPTAPQKLSIPPILKGKNILLMSPTGTGKTEAVLIPIFHRWLLEKAKPTSILYITPLKSLNRDLLGRILWWSKELDFSVAVRHGDTTQRERKLQLEFPNDMIITTPEQLQAMLVGARMRPLLSNIKYVVIDEVHELVDSKRGVQLALALERLRELSENFQIVALSATVGAPGEVAKFIFAERPHEIISAVADKSVDLKVDYPFPNDDDKIAAEKLFIGDTVAARLRAINDLIKSHNATLLFTNTREASEILSSRLRILDKELKHDIHHSSLSKDVRIKTEQEFKNQNLKAIIATSSLQLGIDIGAVDLVIQYMSPREVTQFLQRLGRSGHNISKITKGIILAGDGDDIFESAVIARKSLAKEMENSKIPSMSLDVLSHQIIGLSMSNYQIQPNEVFKIVTRATPYKTLTKEYFDKMLKFMESIHLIWTDKGIARKRRGLEYYFNSMSTIPDNRTFRVVDMTTNSVVGSLDETFIAEHNQAGSSFIVKGRPWRVVSVEKDKVYVEATSGLESAVPAWEGELIPVPYEVSQEVGKLRKEIADGLGNNDLIEKIKGEYPVSTGAAKCMIDLIKRQSKFIVPDNNSMVFENYGEYTVMHACFGSLVNETLARFISALLSAEQGRIIATKSDPYRIIFNSVKIDDIKSIFKKYKPEDIEPVLSASLPNSSLFKHRFIQIAKRFGAIRRDATFENVSIDRIIKTYSDSPLTDETLNEIFQQKLDVRKAEEIFKKVKKGEIEIKQSEKLSPLGELGLKYELHDIAKPDRPESEILKLYKQRLLSTKLRLVCVNCGKYDMVSAVDDIAKEPRCPKCTSKLIAAVSPYMTEAKNIVQKRLKGKDLNKEEMKRLEQIKRSADMIIVYAKKGCIVLAGRGIGPQTCSRILARMHRTDDELYKDMLDAERAFIKNKRYWSN